jgi:hypothetical protein
VELDLRIAMDPDAAGKSKLLDIPRMGDYGGAVLVPEKSILCTAFHLSLPAMMTFVRSFDIADMPDLDPALADVDEALGLSLENELLPAFGEEMGFALVANHEAAGPEMPPIPEYVMYLEVAETGPVMKALNRITEMLDEQSGARRSPISGISRERLETGPMLVVGLDESAGPIRPTYGLIGKYLVVATTERAFREASLGAQRGTAGAFFQTPVAKEAASFFEPPFIEAGLLDFGALVDQLQVYAPQMSGLVADVNYDDMPEDPSEGEWEAYMKRKQAEQQQAAANAEGDVRSWLDVLRVLRFTAWSAHRDTSAYSVQMVMGF